MTYRNKLLLTALITLICLNKAFSDDKVSDQFVLDAGVGVFNTTMMRTLSGSYQQEWEYPFFTRTTLGLWVDNSGNGQSNSGFISEQLGYEIRHNGTIVSIFTGPSFITTPDTVLGGYFQFVSDLHLGLEDTRHNYLGVFYRHISSAGLYYPNLGRDMVGLEIRF